MTRPCQWTVVLLVCFCSAIGARSALSAFDKKLYLLSRVVKEDNLWRNIFLEEVYYKLDRTYYKRIIEDELLDSAQHKPSTTDEVQVAVVGGPGGEGTSSSTPPLNDTRDHIIPYKFVKNIIFKRPMVGSILDMGLKVLMLSFKCLLYKHMVHIIKLIDGEIKRKKDQKKAASWSGKYTEVIQSILMVMGTLQFTDIHVLATLNLFYIYKRKGLEMSIKAKTEYFKQLSQRASNMLDYINDVCVKKIEVDKTKSVDDKALSVKNFINWVFIPTPDYRSMIVESRKNLAAVFGGTFRINSMSKNIWCLVVAVTPRSHGLWTRAPPTIVLISPGKFYRT